MCRKACPNEEGGGSGSRCDAQESIDEIDALSRPSRSTAKPAGKNEPKPRKPKSGQSSREPSRLSSAASELLSVTETILPKPDYKVPPLAHEYQWSKAPSDPALLPGYIHPAHKEKVLQLDDDDSAHFVKRGAADINHISEELDILLSATTLWKSIYHTITYLFQFDSIVSSRNDFICLLIGIARSWDSDAECNPAGIVKTLINDASTLMKTEEELHIAQTALSRICNERNQAMTDVKKLTETTDRLRKDRNSLKAAMQPPKGWLKQQMEEVHRMGKDNEDDDGFTKVSKGPKRSGVRFPASTEAPAARIDVLPDDEEDTPLPLASDPLHRLERETYSSRTPGAAVGRSMGGDANLFFFFFLIERLILSEVH